jgi:hypothetical protein
MKKAVNQLLMEKYENGPPVLRMKLNKVRSGQSPFDFNINIKTFKGKKPDELQWYADHFKLNFRVHKVINLNTEDHENPT